MEKIFENIGAWWSTRREQMRKRSEERKRMRLQEEAERVIQVREYDGKVWFCMNGEPLLDSGALTSDFASIVATARAIWVRYRMGEGIVDE